MLGRIWRGRVRLGPVEKMGGGLEKTRVTSTKEKSEQVWNKHQDQEMQMRWPKLDVGSRVFSFLLHKVGSGLYASVMVSFVAA